MSQDDEYIGYDLHDADHGTMYYKMHWGAYKGHLRGIIRGLVVGCVLGAAIGLGMAGLLALPAVAGALHISGVLAAIGGSTLIGGAMVTAAFSVFGGAMASGIMGRIGNAAGNVATQLSELELRERYPEIPEVSPDSPEPGFGHHYEIPADRDKGKFFHPRVGITGALMGGLFGGMAGFAGLGHMFSAHVLTATALADLSMGGAITAVAGIGALFGSSFGVNRSKFKTVFNFTDNLLHGKASGPTPEQLAKDRERYRLMGEEGPPSVITSLQRQEEFYRLQNGYYKKAFEAGFAGNARGLVGGLVSGGLLGSLLGGAAVLMLGFTGVGAGVVFAGVLAFTMHKSLEFFTEAAFEASGHSHVHEVYHERMRAMRKGLNLSFEEAEFNVVKRRQGDPELTPPDAQKKSWFNPRVALIMGGLGTVIGLGLAPLATGVAGLLGLAAHHIPAALGAMTFGLTGAGFGFGPKTFEKLHGLGDGIYHGAFFPGDKHPEIKTQGRIPLMSPRCELAEHFTQHLAKTQALHHQSDVEMPAHAARENAPMREILQRGARSLTEQAQQAAPGGIQR